MDAPPIRYCRTSEGRTIAYFAMGSGQPFIGTHPHLGVNIGAEFEVEATRRIAEITSRAFTYIRYDPHGCGLSDRRDDDLSVESYVRDIEAVANAAAPDPFVLFATGAMTAPAIVFAAQNPHRLTHLLLWMVMPHGDEYANSTPNRQLRELALTDWRLATESSMRAVDNWEHEELASQMAAMMRESVTPETYVKFEQSREAWDVREWLPRIDVPTLIMHARNSTYYPPSMAQEAAAAIPGARLVLVDSSTVLFPDASIGFVAGEFLGTARRRRPSPVVAPSPTPSGTAIILFADIVDSTALTERMGDDAFRDRARRLDDALRGIITRAGGTAVEGKLVGDGVMAVFSAARSAIEAAIASIDAAAESQLQLHLGIHAGDVIREQGNVFGGAVNIAARIAAASAPNEVLVSDIVRGLARTSAGVSFQDRGEVALKGVSDTVRIYAVAADPGHGPAGIPTED